MSVLTTTDSFLETLQQKPIERPEARANCSLFKRIVDLVASVGGMIALSWLFLLIAAAIKLDSRGPVFYWQDRLGKDGKPFRIYKFRTMVTNADTLGREIRHQGRQSGLLYKDSNDPRVTRMGRLLRQTSLDELPQIFNILRGEMSLVGPRPLPVEDTRYYEEWQLGRLAVSPGLTGLWQVSGRSRLSAQEMVRLDLRYIEEWTPWLDLTIIAKTFKVLLNRDGAY